MEKMFQAVWTNPEAGQRVLYLQCNEGKKHVEWRVFWGISDKILCLNTELRLNDRLDHIDNRFLNNNSGGNGGDEYNYYSLSKVVNMHSISLTIKNRALALIYLGEYWGSEIK